MKRGRVKRSTAAAGLVEAILRKYGVHTAAREHRIVTSWEEIVGPRVGARTWPDGLDQGTLWVRVANSAWLQELAFLRVEIVAAANRVVGNPPLVKDVRFHLGRRKAEESKDDVLAALARAERPKLAPRPPRPQPSVEDLARIDAETARVADPDLGLALRQLRRRLGL